MNVALVAMILEATWLCAV